MLRTQWDRNGSFHSNSLTGEKAGRHSDGVMHVDFLSQPGCSRAGLHNKQLSELRTFGLGVQNALSIGVRFGDRMSGAVEKPVLKLFGNSKP